MLAFDIETVPQEASLEVSYNADDHTPPANYKNPEAIEKWHATNAAKWQEARIKECSLSARLGRVVAISYAHDTGESGVDVAKTPDHERAVLTTFWDRLKLHRDICSWNGKGFDLPFLIARSAILGVNPRLDVMRYAKRYDHTPHFDIKLALEATRQGDTLDAWARAFGHDGKTGDGGQVYSLVQNAMWHRLEQYALRDAELTLALAVQTAPFFGVTCAEMVPALA